MGDNYNCLLYTSFPSAVPLNDRCLEGNSFEIWNFERDVAGSGGEVPVVVITAISLTPFIALVSRCPCQLFRFGLRQFVENFLYVTSHQLLELTLITSSFSCTIFPEWFAELW